MTLCNICNKEVTETDYTEHLWMKHIHGHNNEPKPERVKPAKGVQALAAGITCLVIAFIIGFAAYSLSQNGGVGEGMASGFMIIIAGIIGLIGIGKLIYGGILAGARQ